MKLFFKSFIIAIITVAAALIIAYTLTRAIDGFTDYFQPKEKPVAEQDSCAIRLPDSAELLRRDEIRIQKRLFDRGSWNDAGQVDEFLNRDTLEE